MKIVLPQLSKDLDELQNLKQLIERDETLSMASLQDEDISQFAGKSFTANELRLTKIDATEAKLERTSFSDTELLNSELIATVFSESSWRRVLVKKSRCSGIQLQTSTLKDVAFVDCKLNMANFRFAKLTNVCFEDCVLDEADFYAAQLINVAFQNCSLVKTQFSDATLKQVDLRTSDINDLLGVSSLKGAIIDSIQLVSLAPVLANQLGIDVKND